MFIVGENAIIFDNLVYKLLPLGMLLIIKLKAETGFDVLGRFSN